jgi:hypothetical protein
MSENGIQRPDHTTLVIERLLTEFGNWVEAATIRRVATEAIEPFREARVRDFVPILAWRKARARLRGQLSSRGSSGAVQVEGVRT